MTQPNPQPAVNSNNTVWIYLSYLLGWVFGLIGMAVVKDDEHVRFHCAQAFVLSAIVFLVNLVLGFTIILAFLGWLVWIAAEIYALTVALKAAKGEKVRIPFCADFAEKNVMGWFK